MYTGHDGGQENRETESKETEDRGQERREDTRLRKTYNHQIRENMIYM